MKKYYNATTHEWYNEGQSLTKRVENGVFTGIPSEEQLTQWGFVEWVEPAPTPAELLERAKASKIAELKVYDQSDAVDSFTINGQLATWKQMLVALEVYAGDAINVTEAHKAAIEALATIEDVEAYDFSANYPTKLSF